ncbi:hypothetical protein BDR04DRAFT_1141903 [Suillus decipiens]|nr:hypothetical protein BDR04DRAFT_1141903 [Suillus decipiens]
MLNESSTTLKSTRVELTLSTTRPGGPHSIHLHGHSFNVVRSATQHHPSSSGCCERRHNATAYALEKSMDGFMPVSVDPEDSVEDLSVFVFTFTGQNAPPPDDGRGKTFMVNALFSALRTSGHITFIVGSSVP